MDVELGNSKYELAMVYIDDVVVFSRTIEDHVEHLRNVLERMRNAGLTIHPGKVQLAAPKINLLRFVVDNDTLHPNEDTLRVLKEYPRSHDVKSLKDTSECLRSTEISFHTIPRYPNCSINV